MADDLGMVMESKSLEAKLRSLKDSVQEHIVNTSLRAGAEIYQDAVVEAAPERVDGGPTPGSSSLPEGALKSDVVLQKVPNQPAYSVRFGKLTSHVARWMDRGFNLTKKTKTGKKQIKGVTVHLGFFRRAFETASNDAEKAISASITEQIDKKWKE